METGTARKPKLVVSRLMFNDQTYVDLEENQILVIVGSNNSGKSTVLKEIYNYVSTRNLGKIVYEFTLNCIGHRAELTDFLIDNTYYDYSANNGYPFFAYYDEANNMSSPSRFNVDFHDFTKRWEANSVTGYDAVQLFVNHLTISKRLSVSNPALPFSLFKENPYQPVHHLVKNELLEAKFSNFFKKAFNADLILNRSGGPSIQLHVGEAPEINKELLEDRVSPAYIKKLIQLPTLQDQGDGMRGFVGVLLSLLVSPQSLLLVDEPEAFLHPPQAKLLGRFIGKEIPEDKQIIIATHSEDVLKGLIDVASSRLKIIRLNRNGNVNHVTELNNDELKLFWNDPILRYSNILSGLFHSKVILCEGDADCRFYSAINDALLDDKNNDNLRGSSDLLFVHCGGKDKMPTVCKALKKLGVPLSLAVDIDILREERSLKLLVESLNGDWDPIRENFNVFKQSIEKQKAELSVEVVKQNIDEIFNQLHSRTISNSAIDSIQSVLRKSSPWEQLKRAGKTIIPSGQEYQAFEKLSKYLRTIGVHIVEVGELECFVKSVGNKGPKWVNQVLADKNLMVDDELTEAKIFVNQLVS